MSSGGKLGARRAASSSLTRTYKLKKRNQVRHITLWCVHLRHFASLSRQLLFCWNTCQTYTTLSNYHATHSISGGYFAGCSVQKINKSNTDADDKQVWKFQFKSRDMILDIQIGVKIERMDKLNKTEKASSL